MQMSHVTHFPYEPTYETPSLLDIIYCHDGFTSINNALGSGYIKSLLKITFMQRSLKLNITGKGP